MLLALIKEKDLECVLKAIKEWEEIKVEMVNADNIKNIVLKSPTMNNPLETKGLSIQKVSLEQILILNDIFFRLANARKFCKVYNGSKLMVKLPNIHWIWDSISFINWTLKRGLFNNKTKNEKIHIVKEIEMLLIEGHFEITNIIN